ncbi:SPRY-domain-containing protein C285.10c [Aspergillus terreus]|uniref:SPRY-domain-containing protein C285.10c n=1 Tax=Aspergillus terreus TaxID=33178 RepID=A0A5M3YN87_ASPTE|nr:hypothetical protein ATETN484_0001102500 [Aspergillus terreus]GFF12880.1 SPRY-domain-containing protein C285.10c [Aspergillus terreus]
MSNYTSQGSWGAPPSYEASRSSDLSNEATRDPPPYHNWQEAVPDTATLPPPPTTGYYSSNTGNASADDADRAHEYCDRHPLHWPVRPSMPVYTSVQEHDIRPIKSSAFQGSIASPSPGRWSGSTRDRNGDCLVSTHLPLYFAAQDSPFLTERSKTIYFEVKILRLRSGPGADTSGLAIGFVAHPYPYWRSPGWERGSLGVFSDDGCRFVNDSWGGVEFTNAFRVGETVGLGMTFQLPDNDTLVQEKGRQKAKVDVFFTRDGRVAGGWNLHEEVDADAGGVEGLEGDYDVYGAVGLFGGVDFEVTFEPRSWLWKPSVM